MPMSEAPDNAAPAQRRRVTLLYCDLSGSSALAAAMEAEDYRALLQSLRRIWHEAAQAHQGRVVLTQGDGALLAFGIPLAGEQDGRHAADAALRVHAAVRALEPAGMPLTMGPPAMHSAVHAGLVLLSDGDVERGLYDLSGEVLNTTVQLSRIARRDEVLATLPALGPNAFFFTLAVPELPATAHWIAPSQVRVVRGHSGVTRRFEATARRGLTPFVGRAGLLEQLRGFAAGEDAACGRCVVLQGTAGMGKTRLLEHLLSSLPAGTLVLRGSCESDLQAEVLQPFLQMARACLHLQGAAPRPGLRQAVDAVRPLLEPAAAGSPPAVTAVNAVDGLYGLLAAFAADGPLLLVVDDWQWADDASRQLLQRLRADAGGPRLLLASRPTDAPAGDALGGALHLSLDAFSPEESAQAIAGLLQRPDPFLVARIHAYAGGVPLFIEELCYSVSAQQVLQALDSRTASQGWIATLIVARLQRLPTAQAAVVRAAATIGNVVPLRWLAAACGGAPSAALLQALAEADFLHREPSGDALRFKHGITRDAVYESIDRIERMALHQRLEAALTSETEDERPAEALAALAYHCRGAGSWAAATGYAERAGDRAMAMFALDVARAHYLSAMTALEQQGPLEMDRARAWCQLAAKLGMTCIFDLLALADALAYFRRAVQLADRWGDEATQARAHYWLGYMLYGHGWLRQARHHCEHAIALAERVADARLAAQVRATLGQVLTAMCRYDQALALMDGALQAKRGNARPGSSVAVGSAFTLACKGSVLGDRGHFEASHAAFAEARQLLGDTSHPVANSLLSWEVMVLLWQGRWADALQVAEDSVERSRRSSALLPLAIASAAAGYARWMGDEDGAGFAQIEAAVAWMEQRNVQFYTSIYLGWLVEGAVLQQRLGAARQQARKLLARARAGEVLGLGTGRRALALAALAECDPAQARRHLARAEGEAARRQSGREQALNQQCRARLLAVLGQADAARTLALSAAQSMRRMGMAWHAERAAAWAAAAD